MSAPTSNFNSATPGSAWWLVQSGGQWVTVLGTGGAFVGIVQAALKNLLATPHPTYDGTMIRGADISIDRAWGPKTYKGLWAVVSAAGGSQVVLDAIRIAASSGAVSRDATQVAANLISAQFGSRAVVPADAIMPPYDRAAAGAIAPLTSRPATADEIAAGNLSPSTLPASDQNLQPDTSGGGGNPVPSVDVTVPPPVNPTTGQPTGVPQVRTTGSSISWGAVAAVAAGVVVLGVVAVSVRSDQKRGGHTRKNPSMGPKMARVYLTREPLDRGGYTKRGRYFGIGAPLYRISGEDLIDKHGRHHGMVDDYVRAADRASAMKKVREKYINVRFHGAE